MKRVLFSLVLIGTLSLGVNLNYPLSTNSPLINSNIVIAAEDMNMDMDMGNQPDGEKKDDHAADSKDKKEMSSMSDDEMSNMTEDEMKDHESGTSSKEKSTHEEKTSHEAAGGHGDDGDREYTPPNKIFLATILTIMLISIISASIIRHRRGRVENESIGQ